MDSKCIEEYKTYAKRKREKEKSENIAKIQIKQNKEIW